MFNGIIIGFGCTVLGGLIAHLWRRYRTSIENGIKYIPGKIENALGIDIPDPVENMFVNGVDHVTDVLDASFGNSKYWAEICKLIQQKKSDVVIDKFLEVFKKVDFTKSLEDQIPAEYKFLYDWARQQLAKRMIEGVVQPSLAIAPAPSRDRVTAVLSDEQTMKKVIDGVVAAKKLRAIDRSSEDVRTIVDPEKKQAFFEQLIKDHQERMKRLSQPR